MSDLFSGAISTLKKLEPYPQPPTVQSREAWLEVTEEWRKGVQKDKEDVFSRTVTENLRKLDTALITRLSNVRMSVLSYAKAVKTSREHIDAYCNEMSRSLPEAERAQRLAEHEEHMEQIQYWDKLVGRRHYRLNENLEDLLHTCKSLREAKGEKPAMLTDFEKRIQSAQAAVVQGTEILRSIETGICTADAIPTRILGNELLSSYEIPPGDEPPPSYQRRAGYKPPASYQRRVAYEPPLGDEPPPGYRRRAGYAPPADYQSRVVGYEPAPRYEHADGPSGEGEDGPEAVAQQRPRADGEPPRSRTPSRERSSSHERSSSRERSSTRGRGLS